MAGGESGAALHTFQHTREVLAHQEAAEGGRIPDDTPGLFAYSSQLLSSCDLTVRLPFQTPITSADHATEAYHAGQPSDAEGDSDFADRGEKTPQEEKDDDELCAYSEGWMSHSENLMSHSASEPHHRRLLGP